MTLPAAVQEAPARRSGQRFEALDSLRGLCALIVVLYHFPVASHVGQLAFVRGGYLFVDFFFVLSGFVIAWNYAGRIGDGASLGEFLIKRFFRLMPLHLFILGLYVAVELAVYAAAPPGTAFGAVSGRTLPDLWRTLTLTNSFGMDHQSGWNMPSWSISAEWWTYVAFGLVALALPRNLKAGLAGMVLLGLGVIMAFHPTMHIVPDHGLFRCFFGFGLGAFLATVYAPLLPRLRALGPGLVGGAEIALIAAIVLFVSLSHDNAASFGAPVMFMLAMALFGAEAGPVSRLLHRPLLLRAGVLSYSIYLVHQFVMARARNVSEFLFGDRWFGMDATNPWHMDLQTLLILGAVWFAAEITWRMAEKPGQAMGARLSRQWKARAALQG